MTPKEGAGATAVPRVEDVSLFGTKNGRGKKICAYENGGSVGLYVCARASCRRRAYTVLFATYTPYTRSLGCIPR